MDLSQLKIRQPAREEFDLAVEWEAAESWNLELHDAETLWQSNPEVFLGAELNDELIAIRSRLGWMLMR